MKTGVSNFWRRYRTATVLALASGMVFVWVMAPWDMPAKEPPGAVAISSSSGVRSLDFEVLASAPRTLFIYVRNPGGASGKVRWSVDLIGEASDSEIVRDQYSRPHTIIKSKDRKTVLMETDFDGIPRSGFLFGEQTLRYRGEDRALVTRSFGNLHTDIYMGYQPYLEVTLPYDFARENARRSIIDLPYFFAVAPDGLTPHPGERTVTSLSTVDISPGSEQKLWLAVPEQSLEEVSLYVRTADFDPTLNVERVTPDPEAGTSFRWDVTQGGRPALLGQQKRAEMWLVLAAAIGGLAVAEVVKARPREA